LLFEILSVRETWSHRSTQNSRAYGSVNKEEIMTKSGVLKAGLAGAAASLMLSACVSPDEVSSLDSRVGALERQMSAAEARASAAEAAANQCTATCEEVSARTQRMFQQSMTK
jgi:hypothetical protein